MVTIRRERKADVAPREALLDVSYGPIRFSKTSERLREGRRPGLSFVATSGRSPGRHRAAVGRVGGSGPAGAAARTARGRARLPQARHRLGARAGRAA